MCAGGREWFVLRELGGGLNARCSCLRFDATVGEGRMKEEEGRLMIDEDM
jgi:hypothetical protein